MGQMEIRRREVTHRNDGTRNMTDAEKEWIDNSDFHQLLAKWRHAVVGDPFFIGETGDYFAEAMKRKRKETPHADQVSASKSIGW